jgi:hypothetical protein
LSDDSDIERVLNASCDDDSISEESVDLGCLEKLRAQHLRRKSAAYPYLIDLLKAINNLHDDESNNWRSLPPSERERRWMAEFRMPEAVLVELLALVEPHMAANAPQNT